MAKVMIHPADYDNVTAAVERAFELFPLALAGRSVLIKPNVLRASGAEEGIVTHPRVLEAVIAAVEARNPAAVVVGDNPGMFSYGDNEKSFTETGLMDAAKGYYRNLGDDSVKLAFNPEFMSDVSVSRAVLEADVVISVPKFKTHGLTVLTGAIKNSYGFLPGAQKSRLHKAAGNPERFQDVIVEVFRLRVPDLFIVDAVVGMEGNGPASPHLRHVGRLLAGDNAVAVDAVMAAMMGLDPGRLRFLRRAQAAGLGDYDLSKLEIVGTLETLPDFQLPPLGGEAIAGNRELQQFMQHLVDVRPQVDAERCTACGACVEQCPVGALSMGAKHPEVAVETCITCFCCQEICPEKAIALR